MPSPVTEPGNRIREPRPTCAFCGYPIPGTPVRSGSESATFCSTTCAEASANGEEPFLGREDFKQFYPGVAVLDRLLPWGMPANSFVLFSGEAGMRHRGLQTEIVWRTLERGEPAVIVSFVDGAQAIVDEFLAFDWNVLPYLESGDLHLIDCFTNRLREGHRIPEKQTDWNAYIEAFLEEAVTIVRDPTNLQEVETKLHEAVESLDMVGRGAIVIDSLNEVTTQGRELPTEQFIKEIRTDICKRLFVPIFTSRTTTDENDFAQSHTYIFDGIIDMRHTEDVVSNARLKQLNVRKMDGVRYRPDWVAYENGGYNGFVTIPTGPTPASRTTPPTSSPSGRTPGSFRRGQAPPARSRQTSSGPAN